jgi:glutaredoxin-related protein
VGSAESTTPLSHSNKSPAAPPAVEKVETPEELEERLRRLMTQSNVVLFMKGSPDEPRCGFSRKICGLLRDNKIEFSHFDILTDESVRQGESVSLRLLVFRGLMCLTSGLKKRNDWPTYPQLIVKGDFVGGLDIVQEMADSGELNQLVASA